MGGEHRKFQSYMYGKIFFKRLPIQPEGPEGGVSLPGSSRAPALQGRSARARCGASADCILSEGRQELCSHSLSGFPGFPGVGVRSLHRLGAQGGTPAAGALCATCLLLVTVTCGVGEDTLHTQPSQVQPQPKPVAPCAGVCRGLRISTTGKATVSRSLPTAAQWPPVRLGRYGIPQKLLCRGASSTHRSISTRSCQVGVWGRCKLKICDQQGPLKKIKMYLVKKIILLSKAGLRVCRYCLQG